MGRAGLAVASRVCPGRGSVGPDTSSWTGAAGSVVGTVGFGLRDLCGEGTPGLPGSPFARHTPLAVGKGPGRAQSTGAAGTPPGGKETAPRGPPGAVSLYPSLGGTRVRGPIWLPVLLTMPRGDAKLMRPATHCRDTWVWRLRTTACIRRSPGDRFLMNSHPRPPHGGPRLLPCGRRPPPSVPLPVCQRRRPPGQGSGTSGTLCFQQGAPLCPLCNSLGWGTSHCFCTGHEGHGGPAAVPRCPTATPMVAPERQVLILQARCVGAAALCAWLGRARPGSQALPDTGHLAARRCAPPPKTPGAHPSPALGSESPRHPKRPKPHFPSDHGRPCGATPAAGN